MPATKKRKAAQRKSRLYFSSKISDHRFKKVLWCFVQDFSASETAARTNLSVNSVNAIYMKLRTYFTQVGLFRDFYADQAGEADEDAEFRLLDFHLNRVSTKRGIRVPVEGPDYHLNESHWRLRSLAYMEQRNPENTYRMMFNDLLNLIRISGPVGAPPQNLDLTREYLVERLDQRCHWLERFSPEFREEDIRAELRAIREA